MSKITDLYDYFLEFSNLHDLLPVTAEAERGKEMFFPRGSTPIYGLQNEKIDVLGNYQGTFEPYLSIREDWQFNLFRYADPNDETQDGTNINIENYNDVQAVCNELLAKNAKKIFPNYGGENVIAIIPTGTMPVIWGADIGKQQITYAITIGVYYVNPHRRIEAEIYGIED